MDLDLHDNAHDPVLQRHRGGVRALWSRAARLAVAILCGVAASVAGSTVVRISTAQIGTETPPSNGHRDAARNLLRPQAEAVAARATWRSVDPTDRQADPHSAAVLDHWPTLPSIAGSYVSSA